MRPPSLGWQTHLIFPRFDGEVIERGDHVVVRSPANPTYWWGNFLLFDQAPQPGDAARWRALFDAEIATRVPGTRHVAFGVDTPAPFALPADWGALGFEQLTGAVLTLTAEHLRQPLLPAGFRIGQLDLPRHEAEAVELQVATDVPPNGDIEGYRLFRLRQMRRYAAMEAAGRGHWFGVFAIDRSGERLVADGGLFHDGHGIGRFQHVSTHSEWRRRGLCRALIHAVARHGFDAMGLETLVIVADPEDVAIHAYRQVGFEHHGDMHELQLAPPDASRPPP